jgi:histidyl-tRNA synthetase
MGSNNKPSVPKGTRDFSPAEMVKRNYIFDIIKAVFRKYGYLPLETPAMENLSTLLGKYGEEGDKLLFKILNSGDFLQEVSPGEFNTSDANRLSLKICEKGLRYDLTVPFARYVVQHQHEITFPFKRYQIQPVWRADRPQKGRYREFYQCDADVIGSSSLFNEAELIQLIDEVFTRLSVNVKIKINNRKILAGLAEYIGEATHMTDITVAIDKLEKVGEDKVYAELQERGINPSAIAKIKPLFQLKGDSDARLNALLTVFNGIDVGLKGIEETRLLLNMLSKIFLKNRVEYDFTLARGLNYYTGTIIEVQALDVEIGSICGGGRYDDLTGIFGLPGISGVGISFGADRIYDVINQLNLFPEASSDSSVLLFVNFGINEATYCLELLAQLRKADIYAELYPDAIKIGKQIAYANARKIPYVALIGENEMREGKVTLKQLSSGEQMTVSNNELIKFLEKIQFKK